MATIKDVAREAGVSIATVSCALSGKKTVSHKTRVKVMAAIEKLKFIPNESARKLKLHESREIGVLLTSIDDLYHSEIFKGITSAIQGDNFSVSIGFSNNQPRLEAEIINDFVSRNFAGIILISCMARDSAYIGKLLSRGIPVVFVERRPRARNVNFVGISNKKTIAFLTENLKARGYRNITLFCGNPIISSESDCAAAFREAFGKNTNPGRHKTGRPGADRPGAGRPVAGREKLRVNYTNMTREDAFKVALEELSNNPRPDAIIATSENIAHGILEGAKVLGIPLEGCAVIAFSEEAWMDTRYLPETIHTSRPAFKLGQTAAAFLLRAIRGEKGGPETILFDDNILKAGINIPQFQPPFKKPLRSRREGLNILLLKSPFSSEALNILSRKFENDTGIVLSIKTEAQNKLLNKIIEDAQSNSPKYDVYMFDTPWLNFLSQNAYLEDISDFITANPACFNSVIKEILANSRYQNRYYSVPFVGGAQIMFYRIDLFEDPILAKEYFKIYGTSLRPPRTWQEFNNTARFFTRRFNSSSPVEAGTSCPGIMAEEFCPEIYNRIWGFGGRLFNGNRPHFYSENNIEAFKNLLELQNYIPGQLFSTSIIDTVKDFYSGKTAMLITYTEYASGIMDAINRNIFGKSGFTHIPSRTPISVGWNLGINIFSRKKERAFAFFKWLYRKDVSYYLTVLDGQAVSAYPFENNELLKLYPWMEFTLDNLKYTQKRISSNKKNSIVIPWNKIEEIIYRNTVAMFYGAPIEDRLKDMDEEIMGLMAVYGHFRGNN